jgi:hypothetical protein
MPTRAPTQAELEAMWMSIGEEFSEPVHDTVITDLQKLIRIELKGAVYQVTGDMREKGRLQTALSMVEKWYEELDADEKLKHEITSLYVVGKLKRAVNKPIEV